MSLLLRVTLFLTTVFAGFLAPFARAQAPLISKVEPPSWWAHHSVNPVRLLVRGQHLQGAKIATSDSHLVASDVRITTNGDYLFVNLELDRSTPSGRYPIKVQTVTGVSTFDFVVETPLDSRSNFQGISADDVIYLIMTDRFADGDKSNDLPAGAPRESWDRRNARAYHGGDFRGVINHLPYLKELGVTALWLTPWYDNWNGIKTCDKPWCPSTYYHGYHAIDYYGVEDHFGDIPTLRELVQKAHAVGIKVIQDQVANHIGSHHPWASNPPLDNWFHGSLQDHQLNRFQNSVLLSPHGNRLEVANTLEGWFSDDMPDMNQDEPEVARYEIQNSLWWVGMTGIDGIRQDTIQYVPRTFIRDLMTALRKQYPRMWMVGEVFERDAAQTSFFIGGHRGWDGVDTQLSSVFDFSLWSTSLEVFTNRKPVRALRDQLKYDALYPDPLNLTVMTGNHDTMRFMSLPGATLEGTMLHTAFVLTTRGIAQIYSGDEIAIEGKEDPDNRRDFPGGFDGDTRTAFRSEGRTAEEQRMWQFTHDWITVRQKYPVFRNGQMTDLFYDDDVYAYSRHNVQETAVVIINRSSESRKLLLPALNLPEGTSLICIAGKAENASVKSNSIGIDVPARSAIAYIAKR